MRRRPALLLAVALTAFGLHAAVPATAEGMGELHGTVTDARTGQPLANVHVHAQRDEDGWSWSATTDEEGHWSLTAPEATYRVGATDFSGTYREQWAVDKPDQASADPVVVSELRPTTLDFALAPLPSISGRITDTAGQPVVGFCPQFWFGAIEDAMNYGGACTDEDGRYRQGLTDAGEYRVLFRDYGFGFADQWYDAASGPDDAQVITLGTQDVTGIDAVLQPEATVTTRLVDESGAPLQGCATAYDLDGRFAGNGCTPYEGDSDGTVTITHLAAGRYVVRGNDQSGRHVARYLGGTTTAKRATVLTVATGQQLTAPALTLPLGGVLTGVVTDRLTGEPIGGACVITTGRWDHREGDFEGTNPGTDCTDQSGRYEVFGLEAGSYPVQVTEPFGTHATVWLPRSPDSRGAKKYAVGLGTTTTVDAALAPGGSVSGHVTLVDGATPEYPICVIAFSARTGEQIGGSDCTHEDGSFTIAGLGSNAYKVQAFGVPDGYRETFYPDATAFHQSKSVRVVAPLERTGVDIVVQRR